MPSNATEKRYLLANLTKREVVVPREIGVEPGQRFHVGFDGSLADALYLLTSSGWEEEGDWPKVNDACGRWAGDRVIVVSDKQKAYAYAVMLYTYENVSPLVREAFTELFGIEYQESKSGDLVIAWRRVDLT